VCILLRVEADARVALAVVCAACCACWIGHGAPSAVDARRAAAAGGKEAVGARGACGGEEGVVGGVGGGLDAVARHAGAVGECRGS